MCLIVEKDETQFTRKYSNWHRVVPRQKKDFGVLMEVLKVLKVMFCNNRSVTKRYRRITLSDGFMKFRNAALGSVMLGGLFQGVY